MQVGVTLSGLLASAIAAEKFADLLEVIEGNIQDKQDLEVVKIEKLAEGVEILNESVSIEEIKRLLDGDLFEGEDCKTIGGLLKRLVGFLKKIGELNQRLRKAMS